MPGAPAVGVKARASSSVLMVAGGGGRQGVDAVTVVDEAGAAQRSVPAPLSVMVSVSVAPLLRIGDRHGGERMDRASEVVGCAATVVRRWSAPPPDRCRSRWWWCCGGAGAGAADVAECEAVVVLEPGAPASA